MTTTDQIHLMQLPNPDPTTGRPAHGGRDRHTGVTSLSPSHQAINTPSLLPHGG